MPVESTMPRSWKESSSENAKRSDSTPNRKLLTMNVRSSRVRVSMGFRTEVIDEPIDDHLRREDADQRHVVLYADRMGGARLLEQTSHGGRVEDAVSPYLVLRQEIAEVPRPVARKHRAAVGRAVRLLRARAHR